MRSLIPKRFLIGVAILLPYLVLIWFILFPQTDASVSLPLFHFYIVTFTTFSAAVVSILLSITLRDIARPRHYLAAVAFAAMGVIFFTHGLTTPGAIIGFVHPAISWSAWLTLFGGGLIFCVAALDGPEAVPAWLSVRRVTQGVTATVVVYFAVALFTPQLLEWINANSDPWHRWFIFYTTFGLWLLATFRFVLIWRSSGSRVDGTLAFVAYWMGAATVSMHQFPVWQLSWWQYHFILLAGFLLIFYILLIEYEQAREFRLLRYYLASSLIVTALIALAASYLFAQFSYQTLVAEKRAATTNLMNMTTGHIAESIPEDASLTAALANYADRLPAYPVGEVLVYDDQGFRFNVGGNSDVNAKPGQNVLLSDYRPGYEQALTGETIVEVNGSMLNAFTPLYGGQDPVDRPIGVAIASQTLPDLNQAVLRARTTGLLIATLSMSVLFGILWLVVARADGIITTRTEELAVAYENLRQAERMRDDLSRMIVHDLKNPLSTIYGSLGLVTELKGEEHAETHAFYLDAALHASERMSGLIDDILNVGKIEAGQLKPNIEPALVNQLLSERLGAFAAQAKEQDKQLLLDCPSDLKASFDCSMIGRVVDNLVSNALKYTDRAGRIQVSAWADNGQLCVRVRDDGEGIPDDYKHYIFGKFAQAPNAVEKPNRTGTGLGLTFCNLVVQLHGGNIWVEDAPGGGSDFNFRFPLNQNGPLN